MCRKPKATAEAAPLVPLPSALLGEVVKGPIGPAQVQAVFQSFKKAVIKRAMGAEMRHHLGYIDLGYIEMWYNHARRHSTFGYISAADYEAQQQMAA